MNDRLIEEVVDGCTQRAGQFSFTFSWVLAAAGAALGQPVLAGLVPHRLRLRHPARGKRCAWRGGYAPRSARRAWRWRGRAWSVAHLCGSHLP